MRIISLIPSATEIACELGLIDQIVGISHDCDWPPEIEQKPILSEAIVNSEYPSADIDQIVRETIHNGMSVYHLDQDVLNALRPDLILTQELCEVCAPSFDDVQVAARIMDVAPQIISLEPKNITEILENILLVGEATSTEARAEAFVASAQSRIDHIRELAFDVDRQPRVLCVEWLSPIYVGGHWVPEMVDLAGGEPLGDPSEPSFEISWEDVLNFDPEIVVVMPCGFSPQRAAREMDLLTDYDEWEELRAVKNGQVFIVHGSYYFSRPGPRVIDGLEILANIIHPELFSDLELPEGSLFRWEDE